MSILLSTSSEFFYNLFVRESGSLQISQKEGDYRGCPQNIVTVSNSYIFAVMRHNQMKEKLSGDVQLKISLVKFHM